MEKRFIRMICGLAALLLCCAFAMGCAAADGAQGGNEVERLLAVQDFKFQQVEKGIGFGVPAVYSAPSTDALRGARRWRKPDMTRADGCWCGMRRTTAATGSATLKSGR